MEIFFSHRVFFFFLFIFPGLVSYILIGKKNKQKVWFLVIFFLFTFEVSMRVSGGTDYLNYEGLWGKISSMSKLSSFTTPFEPGFVLYVFVLSKLSDSIHFFQFVSFFIPCLIFVYLKTRLRLVPSIMVLVFYSSFYAPYYLNGIGQGMAMALFLWVFFLLNYQRNSLTVSALFGAVTSFLVHKSGIFSVLLFGRSRKMKAVVFFGLIIFAIFSSQILALLQTDSPVNLKYNFHQEIGLIDWIYRVLHIAVMLFFLKFVPDIPLLRNAIYVYLVGFILFCALISFPIVAIRIHMFFRIMEIIIYPIIASHLIKPETRLIFTVSLCCLYLPQAAINWLSEFNVVAF